MGAALSTQNESLEELLDIYKSPGSRPAEDVRVRLLETLYFGSVPSSIVNRFYAQHITKAGSPRIWTESTFTDFLIKAFSTQEHIIRPASPVLFRSLLHHGCYPFKPNKDDIGLTLERLGTGVAFMAAADKFSIVVNEQQPRSTYQHSRNWEERCRLLFQSLCDTDWARTSSEASRTSGDDYDLIAVLYSSMPQPGESYPFPSVAATLPSSYSLELNGRVLLHDIAALIRLLLVVAAGHTESSRADIQSGLDGAISSLLGPFQTESIGWGLFKTTLETHMPYLLTHLAAFVLSQFPIEGFVTSDLKSELDIELWPLPPAILGEQGSQSRSFLSLAQFCQLGLFLRRKWFLSTLSILHQGKPQALQPSTIHILISGTSPRLFLIRGTIEGSSPVILGAYLPSLSAWEPKELNGWFKQEDPFWLPNTDNDCFFQLSPTHAVYRGVYDKARVDVGARGTLSFHIGGASLWFEQGLRRGSLCDLGFNFHLRGLQFTKIPKLEVALLQLGSLFKSATYSGQFCEKTREPMELMSLLLFH
ncbi:uncharacterized protein BDR25DRAFT_360892 [Lindgomyces ingoldianus]|uniref:Uncharacterized protein n=1 Tax=Lindgomyces ingoldianus TaxID=673940 RepID=A0ACB6QDG1_9PLEO|nr:uncharacterized protein BDR25DRAFT_360892 [Lindgomyces ingoldianus]KAF2464988.1 hypothetical protein BDR25DRAFT_360892 [Lindgomyces ingoldianus]